MMRNNTWIKYKYFTLKDTVAKSFISKDWSYIISGNCVLVK